MRRCTMRCAPRRPALAPAVRSLSYGAVRGYYRHEAILGRLLSQPVRSLDFLVRALTVGCAVRTGRCANTRVRRRRCGCEDRKGDRRRACRWADQRRAAPLSARAQSARCGNRAQPRVASRLAGVAGGLCCAPIGRCAGRNCWRRATRQAPMWLRVDGRRTTAAGYVERLREADIGARLETRVAHAAGIGLALRRA